MLALGAQAGRRRAGRARGRRAAAGASARGARGAGVAAGRAQQGSGRRAAWARGLATGCALGALDLFSIRFDSVLFLSQFLDIIRDS